MPFNRQRSLIFSCLVALGLAVSIALPSLASSPTLRDFSSSDGAEQVQPMVQPMVQPIVQPMAQMMVQSGETSYLDLTQQAQAFYEAGQYPDAIAIWQTVLNHYQRQNDTLNQARILSHLALAYQGLGQWSEASQAMTTSLQQLPHGRQHHPSTEQIAAHAQILNNRGNLQLNQGQPAEALLSWQQAENLYQQVNYAVGIIQTQLNQAEAMYDLGFYQRAVTLLKNLEDTLKEQPPSQLEVVALRRLGNLLRMVGQIEDSQQALTQSLATAQTLQLPAEIAETLISLGQTSREQNDVATAAAYYQQAASLPLSAETALRNQLAQLSLWVSTEQTGKARRLWPSILTQLDQIPANHTSIYSRIHLVQNLVQLNQADSGNEGPDEVALAKILVEAVHQSQEIGDRKAEAFALGRLGGLYEQTQQWVSAIDLTGQALDIAQSLNASELVYPFQWQLGRLLNQQDKRSEAIAAYSEAVNILKTLRGDLATVNSDIQFSFQDSIEPIYRELVGLLLQPDSQQSDSQKPVSQASLEKARDTIESLQLAELDDFFKEACLDVQPIQIDEIDPLAAIFYPIILGDRLEVILRLPNQPLKHYTSFVSQSSIETLSQQLRQALVIRSKRDYFALSQQLYDWLIRPVAADLKSSGVETLVFVSDRAFQTIPMATLYDGQHFLIEDYGVALTPGLKLLPPNPIARENLKILAAGLSEGRQGFSPLSYVATEIEAVKTAISQGEVLLNQTFTREALVEELQTSTFPIVHIATHGQFSSTLEDTFLLSWDNRINVTELDQAIQTGSLNQTTAIELLVLSACETATGDKRAALGLAGTAVKAGARSTIATLWSINDAASAELMGHFYHALTDPGITKAEALRQAQLKLLQSPQYRHPIYWAPYILLGNWL